MTDTSITTDTATTPVTPATTSAMTPADAATKLSALRSDKSWTDRLLAGDGPTVREFHELSAAKHQADRIEAVLARTATPQDFEITTDGKLNTARLIQSVENLREIGVEEKPLRDFMTDTPITKKDQDWVRQYERQLKTDAAFVQRYLSGEAAAVKEMTTIRMHLLRPTEQEKN